MRESQPHQGYRKLHPALAIALHYEPAQGQAPKVVASGRGVIAENIEKSAREHGVPVHQDGDLAQLLSDVEVQQTIPEELFEAVARVLSFVWRVDSRMKKSS